MPGGAPIQVAVVVTRFIAGAGGVALRGAVALESDLFHTTVMAAEGGNLLEDAARAGLDVVPLRHMRHEMAPRSDVAALREVAAHIEAGQFQVVHTHSAKAGMLGRLAARWNRVPGIVHTFHGFPFHTYQSALRRRTYIGIERALGRITDRFLAVGAAVAADAVRLEIAPAERIRTIGSAIDPMPARTPQTRSEARRRLGIPESTRVAGTVGRLDFQKAPHDVLRAFSQLDPDVHFVWIGSGPLFDDVKRRVAAAGFADRFHLLGERRDVAQLLPALDAFAMASLYEGLPCSVVEAMTCGIPVVATAVNSVSEVVVPGRTGLIVPPRRPDQLARAIQHLLDHPEHGGRMAAAARANLGDRFGVDVLASDLTDTYLSVLEGRVAISNVTTLASTA
ncbi:MAG TPA: glycosyltransferase [Candidatus Dormibacteraeota bacterium]